MSTENKAVVQHTEGNIAIRNNITHHDIQITFQIGKETDWEDFIFVTGQSNGDIEFSHKEAKANAEHIVRCWNNFYPLLNALKNAVSHEENIRELVALLNKEFNMDEPNQLQWVTEAIAVIKAAEE